MKFIL